jgi:hypothetical protein
MAGDS